MRVLTRVAPTVFAALLCASAALAQDGPAPDVFKPAGEVFSVRMPKRPSSSAERVAAAGLKVSGRRYEAADESGRRYVVWSLKGRSGGGDLDVIAEVAWQLLVAPAIERVAARKETDSPQLSYRGAFSLGGGRGREYTFTSKQTEGPVYVCADGTRVYVVAALGEDSADPRLKQFVQSFSLRADAPAASSDPRPADGTGSGMGMGTGSGVGEGTGSGPLTGGGGEGVGSGPVDYNRTFRQGEVMKRAVITAKPEPVFTEQARRFNVSGVVRLRAILNKTGQVLNISVIKGLPHGLTQSAIAAAKGIKFQPAQKDGRQVSQYVTIEYNFNIY